MSQSSKIKPLNALWIILSSTLCVLSISLFILHKQKDRIQKSYESCEYNIQILSQMGPVKEALKTVHLAELLQLSLDEPINLRQYDLQQAKQQLLHSGVVSSVELKKKWPNALEVDYEIRRPIAYLGDYANTLVDEKGVIFPLSPYFTPKILPSLYLGLKIEPFEYGKIENEKMQYALDIYDYLSKTPLGSGLVVDRIDVSKVNVQSLGQREIILTLYETLGNEDFVRYVRLSTANYKEELMHFLDLKAMNHPQNLVVDLRLFPNAYLTPLDWR